jgi:hypothetical protein
MGYAMAAILGAPTERVNSGIMESEMIEMPAASISLCTSPTDRQQNGQTGTSKTVSPLRPSSDGPWAARSLPRARAALGRSPGTSSA